jgi:Nif-specific regulatory protein
LSGVYEVSKLLAAPIGLEQMLAGVIAMLSSYLDMRCGLIALVEPEGALDLAVGLDRTAIEAEDLFAALPERFIGQILTANRATTARDLRSAPGLGEAEIAPLTPDGDRAVSLIGVPIKNAGRPVGVLILTRRLRRAEEPEEFDEDVRFLAMIANLIGQTVRLHKAVARDRARLLAQQGRMEKQVITPARDGRAKGAVGAIIGQSDAVRAMLTRIRIVAQSHTTVILRGESGTGKELLAAALHELSPRMGKPFVRFNCAAMSESVLESELFGHEKGAFTGALAQRKGRFEMADGGTVFLDEIGEISAPFQAKLLRVLQEGEFERVGGSQTLKVDVRIVCATNRNLEEAVESGDFRADLYYRLSVVPIIVPPLRERREDIPALAQEFMRRFNAENSRALSLGADAVTVLEGCYFPGNIRELENCVRRTATLAPDEVVGAKDFACRSDVCLSSLLWRSPPPPDRRPPQEVPPRAREVGQHLPVLAAAPSECPHAGGCNAVAPDPEAARERAALLDAMESSGWVQAKAARILGQTPRQIGYALKKHNIPMRGM